MQVAIETLGGMFGVHIPVSKVQERTRERKRKTQQRKRILQEAMQLQVPSDDANQNYDDLPDDLYDTLQMRIKQQEQEAANYDDHTTILAGNEQTVLAGNEETLADGMMLGQTSSDVTDGRLSCHGNEQTTSVTFSPDDVPTTTTHTPTSTLASDKLLRAVRGLHDTMVETRDALHGLCAHLREKEEDIETRHHKAREWHQVALALDRTFFFIYLACLIVLLFVSSAILFPRAI